MEMTVTIYKIQFLQNIYIGSTNNLERRYNHHYYLLKTKQHFNIGLTELFKDLKRLPKAVALETVSATERWEKEEYYISLYKNQGYKLLNISMGAGLKGLNHSAQHKEAMSVLMSGEGNPSSKIKYSEFLAMIELFLDGLSNKEIANVFSLHPRYVSLIRHKKRLKSFWEKSGHIKTEIPNSTDNTKLNYNEFLEILELISVGETNKLIGEMYDIDPSIISRIRHEKTYKHFYKRLRSSTTIEKQQ